jgi:hypothetical protein
VSARPGAQRYLARMILWMAAFLVVVYAAKRGAPALEPGGVGAHVVWLLPLLPLLGALFTIFQQHRQQADELERQIELQAMTLSFGLMLIAATGWGFLVRTFGYAPFPLDMSLPVAVVVWAVVRAALNLRYR